MIENRTATQTWQALQENPSAQLVDVRTDPEWHMIGLPNLESIKHHVHTITWEPGGEKWFLASLCEAIPDKTVPVYFLCRSGVRSHAAATLAQQAGYTQVFNVGDGFEGPPDETGTRGHIAGWQAEGLPTRHP